MRWKALAEIYTMHSFAPFSMLKIFVKNRWKSAIAKNKYAPSRGGGVRWAACLPDPACPSDRPPPCLAATPPHPRTPNNSVAGNDARTHGGCLFLIGPIRKRHIYLKNFPAARAKWLRNPIWKRHLYFKKFPAARAKWLRNPIRKRHIYLKQFLRCAGYRSREIL